MSIRMIKIRATVSIGSGFIIRTPFVQSFNVRKSRGQISSFDASLKVSHNEITQSNMGGRVTISAGEEGNERRIFTGILKKATVSPCWDDPGYVLLNISGVDELSKLQGKKYTRRCRATKSTWVSIEGVVREGLRDGKFAYETDVVTISPDRMVPGGTESSVTPKLPTAKATFNSPAEVFPLVEVHHKVSIS